MPNFRPEPSGASWGFGEWAPACAEASKNAGIISGQELAQLVLEVPEMLEGVRAVGLSRPLASCKKP